MATSILRLPQVMAQYGLGRSSIYLRVKQGLFVRPVALGPRAIGWSSDEIAALVSARIAGKSDEEIRALVAKLEQQRKSFP